MPAPAPPGRCLTTEVVPMGVVSTRNLVLGPASVYRAPSGTAEPADATVASDGWLAPPPSPWRDFGATNGGVTLEADGTLTNFEVDQMILDPGARVTKLA